MAFSILLLG